jgi:hypothetical protein
MKNYLLIASLLLLILSNLFGEVKNGYEENIPHMKLSLQSLKNILFNDQNLSADQKRKIKERIKSIVNYIVYYEITDAMLKQFRGISPDLYNEIDTLKDSKGRIIDVYVKFIPKEQAQYQAEGIAAFTQEANDLNSCSSEYGAGSVSVNIWIWNKALLVLAHEFGHIKYLVPNLTSYVKFYQKKYPTRVSDSVLGHSSGDPSGKMAWMFEARFRESYGRYLKQDFDPVLSPMVLINPIKKNLLQDLDN